MIPQTLTRTVSGIAAALLIFAGTNANAAELVVNGGFEQSIPNQAPSGFPPGWTNVDNSPGVHPPYSGVDNSNGFQHSGNQYAFLGAQGVVGTLSQTLNLVVGGAYTLSFWLANDGDGSALESFGVIFNNQALLPIIQAPNGGTFGPYTLYTFAFNATSASSLLQFQYRHEDSFYRLDDVSVQGPAPAPEGGATLLLAFPALLGLCVMHFRRSRLAL